MPGTPEFQLAEKKGVAGLTAQQIAMFGLEGETSPMRPTVDPFNISARASYRKEIPLGGVPARQRHHRHGGCDTAGRSDPSPWRRRAAWRRLLRVPTPDLPSAPAQRAHRVHRHASASRRSPSSSSPSSSSSTTQKVDRPGYVYIHSPVFAQYEPSIAEFAAEEWGHLFVHERYIRPKMRARGAAAKLERRDARRRARAQGCRVARHVAHELEARAALGLTAQLDTSVNVHVAPLVEAWVSHEQRTADGTLGHVRARTPTWRGVRHAAKGAIDYALVDAVFDALRSRSAVLPAERCRRPSCAPLPMLTRSSTRRSPSSCVYHRRPRRRVGHPGCCASAGGDGASSPRTGWGFTIALPRLPPPPRARARLCFSRRCAPPTCS